MKKYTLFIISLLLINTLYGQGVAGIFPPDQSKYTILDSANYKFTYEYTYIQDVNKLNSPITDQLFLLVGNTTSKFSNTTFLKKNHDELEVGGGGKAMAPGTGLNGTEVFKNTKTKKANITTRTFAESSIYTYEEDASAQVWKITSDTTTILSYPCLKATTEFRGRTYTAWFTLGIPINNGPWKFGGLPGMILKVTDSQNYFSFVCTGVQVLKKKEPIVKFDGDYVSTSQNDINNLVKQMHQNFARFLTSLGKTFDEDTRKIISKPKPYNPLELE